jgi:hypothetical protein
MTRGRKLIYLWLQYYYYEALISKGVHSVYDEPAFLTEIFTASAANMVVALPQAKLTVLEVVAMMLTKHGATRAGSGSIAKGRISKKERAPKKDKDGLPVKPRLPVPKMFTREAARAMN